MVGDRVRSAGEGSWGPGPPDGTVELVAADLVFAAMMPPVDRPVFREVTTVVTFTESTNSTET
jgi:hypothetical protein